MSLLAPIRTQSSDDGFYNEEVNTGDSEAVIAPTGAESENKTLPTPLSTPRSVLRATPRGSRLSADQWPPSKGNESMKKLRQTRIPKRDV